VLGVAYGAAHGPDQRSMYLAFSRGDYMWIFGILGLGVGLVVSSVWALARWAAAKAGN
jgi:hypothetical protein